nr:MAG TPA: hypothetical protein [Bacteriophage sp.]
MIQTAKAQKSILDFKPKFVMADGSEKKTDRAPAKVLDGVNKNIQDGFASYGTYYGIFDKYVVFAYKDSHNLMYQEGYVYKFKTEEDAKAFYDGGIDRGSMKIIKGASVVAPCLYSLKDKKFMSIRDAVEELANGYVRDALSSLDKYIGTNAIPFDVEDVTYEYSVLSANKLKLYDRGYDCSLSVKIKLKDSKYPDKDTFKVLSSSVDRYVSMGAITSLSNGSKFRDYITMHSYLCN